MMMLRQAKKERKKGWAQVRALFVLILGVVVHWCIGSTTSRVSSVYDESTLCCKGTMTFGPWSGLPTQVSTSPVVPISKMFLYQPQ